MIAVVGGGPIGLAIAWRCTQRGHRVTVFDPAPGSGAAAVAAGMLAPDSEAYFGEGPLQALLLESARRWPAFAAELVQASGMELGYRTEGTLQVALTADDLAEMERLRAYQAGLGRRVSRLTGTELRDREPLLTPRVRGGAYAADDHQVDPRRLVAALAAACRAAGVTFDSRRVTGLSTVDAPVVVVAAGCGSGELTGLPVRPVKGQVVRLRAAGGRPPGLRHVIRGLADGRPVYLVPRADGEVVVGATSEERGDLTVTAGAVSDLLRAALALVPELAEYELVEARAGLRPTTADNTPVIAMLDHRTVVATGHYRHGILLTPATADRAADLVERGLGGGSGTDRTEAA